MAQKANAPSTLRLVHNYLRWGAPQDAPYSGPTLLEAEILPHRRFLTGLVLNAGAGTREIAHLVDGKLVNSDIAWPGDTRTNIDIYAPLHELPVADGHFDSAVCIAVLEHVINPEECVRELHRVLKPGGHLVVSVPFMQPEHKVPGDYQRYTRDGLSHLVASAGFEVVDVRLIGNVYHTLYWIAWEWLQLADGLLYQILRRIVPTILWLACRRSRLQSDRLAFGFNVLARKPAP
jgi:SAM-dependent methyltransferase